MKIFRIILAAVLVLAVIIAVVFSGDRTGGNTEPADNGGAPSQAQEADAPGGDNEPEAELRRIETAADADEWISVFLGEHPEDLEGAYEMSPQMNSAVAQLGGLKAMAASLAQLGTLEKLSPAYEGTIQGYKAFHVPCKFSNMPVDIVLVVDKGAIAGLNTGPYTGGKEDDNEAPEGLIARDLALPVPELGGELGGTLTLPEGEGPFPAVVLIHGSGPNDRDETIMNQKPFKDLAEGLAKLGVAVYRFDKRTYVYGAAMPQDRSMTLEDESIKDAVAAVQLLAKQEGIDPSRIFVLGHSLGGNAVPAIAEALENAPVKAAGFIMMAASPRPLEVLVREQYEFIYSLLPNVTAEQQAEKDKVFADLDKLKDIDDLPDDETVMGAYVPYWRWLAEYDITAAAKAIKKPCLLLQGEEDYQVTMTDFDMWKEALGDKANWTLISYPGLTHAFTAGKKTDGSSVYMKNEKVNGEVIEDIADFILAN